MTTKVPISVLVPVKNEAGQIARCLTSVAWAEEIFVVDSQSSDATTQIAADHGAVVVQFHFNGIWPKKKNWALAELPFGHEWVLILDADEVLPAEAEAEIREIVSRPGPHAGYWINRRFMFMGRWLAHAYYPNWNLRLFKHRLGRYEQLTDKPTASGDNEVHEHVIVEGSTGFLRAEMDHYAFPSVEVFVEKHNRYSNWEAHVALAPRPQSVLQHGAVSGRRYLKMAARHLPFRPLLRFLYVYVWQRGFLDGVEGYYFARLHGMYELLSAAKTCELRRTRLVEESAGGNGPGRLRRWVGGAAFGLCLAAVLFFVLRPSPRGERVDVLPARLGHWINAHDAVSNVIGFTGLALLWFFVEFPGGATTAGASTTAAGRLNFVHSRAWRCGVFCAFSVLLEFVQFCIPGRVYDLVDVAAGWLGAGLAAVVWTVVRRRKRRHSYAADPLK